MKRALIILSLGLLAFTGCKKSGSDPKPNKPTNPTNPTNPATGGITITSVASATTTAIYTDDSIVITGTGFNADKTKDTVLFGYVYNKTFYQYNGTGGSQPAITGITSATTTQLKIYAQNPVDLDYNVRYGDKAKYPAALAVYTNGKLAYTTLTLAPIVTIIREEDDDKPEQTIDNTYPGDTLKLVCNGVIQQGTGLTVGGKDLKYTVTTFTNSGGTTSTLHAYMAPAFFGDSNIDTATIKSKVVLTQSDGKTFSKTLPFWRSPRMTVSGVKPEQATYSLSGEVAVIKVHITGKYLKSDAYYEVEKAGGGYFYKSALGIGGFPNTTDVNIGLSGLPIGQYNVYIARLAANGAETVYGIGGFTVIK